MIIFKVKQQMIVKCCGLLCELRKKSEQKQFHLYTVRKYTIVRLPLSRQGSTQIHQWQNSLNSLRPRQNGRLFAVDTFKRIFLNENIRISTKNSLKFVPKGLINNIPALVLIMAWRRPGDKPLSEPMLVRSLTHICVTRPQWVNVYWNPRKNKTSVEF